MYTCSIHKLYVLLDFVFSQELCPLVVLSGIKKLLQNCFVRDVFVPAIIKASFPTVPNYNPRYHNDPQLTSNDHIHKPQLCLRLEGGRFWLRGLLQGPLGPLAVGADDFYVPEIWQSGGKDSR